MDFDNWWKDYIGSDTDKSLELGSIYAESAWNQQQKRIAELEAENQWLRDELWKEEKFCRGSGDIDRANELAALLEGE